MVIRGELPTENPERRGVAVQELALHEGVLGIADLLLPEGLGRVVAVGELRLPPSRPDAVIARVREDVWIARRDAGIGACTAPALLEVVELLRRKGGSATSVELARFRVSRDQRFRRSVSELVQRGLVARHGDGLRLHEAWNVAMDACFGVEAKLGSIDKARRQVALWERHVDGVYLALPRGYVRNIDRSDPLLRRFGLIAVDGSSAAAVVRRPRTRRARGAARLLCEEQMYQRWLGRRSTS